MAKVTKQFKIMSMLNKGYTAAEVAEHFGVSRAYVYVVKSTEKKKGLVQVKKKKKPEQKFVFEVVEPVDAVQADDPNAVQIGGDHYKSLGVQPWDAMESWLTPEEFRGFLKGNAIKYLARKKNADDLLKAQHYLLKLNSLKSGA